jgi:hypothetical protein
MRVTVPSPLRTPQSLFRKVGKLMQAEETAQLPRGREEGPGRVLWGRIQVQVPSHSGKQEVPKRWPENLQL